MSRWEDCARFCLLSSSSCQAWSYVDESRWDNDQIIKMVEDLDVSQEVLPVRQLRKVLHNFVHTQVIQTVVT